MASGRCVAGDARDEAPYRAALEGARADLLLTDPPYCLLTRRRKGGDLRDPKGRKIDRDPVLRFESVRDYRKFSQEWLARAVPHVRPERPIILWTNFLGQEPLLISARELGYGELWGRFVWGKRSREASSNEQLVRVYEIALVLSRAPRPPRDVNSAPECWSAITGYDDEGEGGTWGDHPHHKPFSAIEPLIRAYSRSGEMILDPFAGSGSIGAAALQLERNAASIELKPDWADRIQERLRRAK